MNRRAKEWLRRALDGIERRHRALTLLISAASLAAAWLGR